MTTSVAGRFAGKALGDFLKVASGIASGAVQEAALSHLLQSREQVDAPGIRGQLASVLASLPPESTAKLLGATAPVAAAATVVGTGALLSTGQQSDYSLPVQASMQSRRPSAFTTQPYMPGTSTLTNDQVGEALLNQQRYQHQLNLIQARQNASGGMGSLPDNGNISDIIGLAQRIYG
jgi:hypothetical protein